MNVLTRLKQERTAMEYVNPWDIYAMNNFYNNISISVYVFMIINQFRYPIYNNPPQVLNVCTKACPERIDPCDNIYEALDIVCSAGPAQGHICDDALFDAFILDYPSSLKEQKNVWIYIRRTNFNNVNSPPPGFKRGDQITLTIQLSKQLVEMVNRLKDIRAECCNLNLALFPAPYPNSITLPYDDGSAVFLPSIDENISKILIARPRSRIHDNIVATQVYRVSDGTKLADFIWQGDKPIDLCVALEGPGTPVPVEPIFPVL